MSNEKLLRNIVSEFDENTANISGQISDIKNEVNDINKEVNKISDDIAFICTDDYNHFTGEYCGEWKGATLRKLPLWNEQVGDDEITFEFPTEADFAQMTHDVTLNSLEFEYSDAMVLGSVKANLSNGVSSERYMKDNFKQLYASTPPSVIELD